MCPGKFLDIASKDGWMMMDVSKMDEFVVLLGFFFQAKQPKMMANYGPQFLN